MKAIICTRYGPPEVLQYTEVAKPDLKPGCVLIKLTATSVTLGDCEFRGAYLPKWISIPMRLFLGWSKPKFPILGMEFAGVVESVPEDVTEFKPGQRVFGAAGIDFGTNAEYRLHKLRDALVHTPDGVSDHEVATLAVGGINALHFLRLANIKQGEHVLVNGAGGSIGTYGVQLARYFGAGHITAIDSANKHQLLTSLGADKVIDFRTTDFTKLPDTYDVIFDVVGKAHFGRVLKCLRPNGRYLLANPSPSKMIRSSFFPRLGNKKSIYKVASPNAKDLAFLAELIAKGKLKPAIEKQLQLHEIPDAHRYIEAGHKKGCITVSCTVAE